MTMEQKSPNSPKTLFLANWSGYYSLNYSLPILDKLLKDCNPSTQQYYIAMPYGYLDQMPDHYRQSGFIFGTDKIPSMEQGAFTESISVKLITNAQAKFTLLNSNEHKETIPKKIKAVIQAGLTPFLCVGENSESYESSGSKAILTGKLSASLQDISPHQLINLNIIYEAPWIHKLPYQPSLDQLVEAYRQFRELLQSQVGIQIANGMNLICAVPHDFEDLPTLIKESGINGLYLAKAISHQNQLHRMFASDLHLHGEFEVSIIDENASLPIPSEVAAVEETKEKSPSYNPEELKPIAIQKEQAEKIIEEVDIEEKISEPEEEFSEEE
jgi:triosephosphate isomerase (TIM)